MSISNYRDIPSQLAVTNQPQANLDLGSLDIKQSIPFHEKSRQASLDDSHYEQHRHCEHGPPSSSGHHSCHNSRLKHLLLPALLALVALGGLLAWSCVNRHGLSGDWGLNSLVGRAFNDTSSGSIFTRNKLWLIVLIVGFVVLLILAIMLSACCCRGVFENPLCCPCYLCACCGGLACLECIGCGLCAAANS